VDGRVFVPQGGHQGFNGTGVPDPPEHLRGGGSDGCTPVLQIIHEGDDGGGADAGQGIRRVSGDGLVSVSQGFDQRIHGAIIPDLSENTRGGGANGRVLVLQGGDHRSDRGGTDAYKGIRDISSHGRVFVPHGRHQRLDGTGISDLPEGRCSPAPDGHFTVLKKRNQSLDRPAVPDHPQRLRGPTPDRCCPVSQKRDQRLDGSAIPDLAKGFRGPAPDRCVPVLQKRDQRRDVTNIPDLAEGFRGPAPHGRIDFLQGRDQRLDGGGTDAGKGIHIPAFGK